MHTFRRIASLALATLLAALVAAACGGSDPPAADAGVDASPTCPAPLVLAWGRREAGAFVPFADGDTAKITMGFQGFRFIDGVARLSGVSDATAGFRFQATLDGRPPSTQDVGRLDLARGPDGALYAEPLMLFFNDVPLPEVLGRDVKVLLRATTTPACTAQLTLTLKLVRGGCQDADGGTTCPDGGT